MYNVSSCACLHVVHYSVAKSVLGGERAVVALDRRPPVPSGPTAKLLNTVYTSGNAWHSLGKWSENSSIYNHHHY